MMAVNPPQRIGAIDRDDMTVQELDVFFPRPHALTIDPATNRIFTASLVENRVAVVEGGTEALELVDIDGPPHTLVQFALSPDGRRLVATTQLTGKLLVFDATTPALALAAEVEVGTQPWHPVFSPSGDRVYFGAKDDDAVVVVETEGWSVLKRITAPGIVEPHGSAVTGDGRHLFVSNRNLKGTYAPARQVGEQRRCGDGGEDRHADAGSRADDRGRDVSCGDLARGGEHVESDRLAAHRCVAGRGSAGAAGTHPPVTLVRTGAAVLILSGFTGVCAPAPAPLPPAPVSSAPASDWERVIYGIAVTDEAGEPIDHPFLGGFNLPRPQLADADGDGDLDLFIQERSNQVMFFRNEAEGGPPAYRWVTDAFEDLPVGEWFRFVDVDLDGDLDLLAEEPFSYIRYYRNDGGEGPAAYVLATDTIKDVMGEPVFSDRQNIPNAADIDCDGMLDLLIGRLTGTITRYEAESIDDDGVPRFRHVTDSFEDIEIIGAFQGSLHGANTMALGDIDEDGDHDLFWGDFFEPGLLFIENTGSCRRPVLRGVPRPFPLRDPVSTSGYNAPALGDMDQDGDMDLTMGVLGGAFNPNLTTVDNLHQFEQGADGAFTETTTRLIRSLDVGSESIPAFTDLDGDGDMDLARVQQDRAG